MYVAVSFNLNPHPIALSLTLTLTPMLLGVADPENGEPISSPGPWLYNFCWRFHLTLVDVFILLLPIVTSLQLAYCIRGYYEYVTVIHASRCIHSIHVLPCWTVWNTMFSCTFMRTSSLVIVFIQLIITTLIDPRFKSC